jgi:predicted RecA/RadA family phage recombinase
MSHASRSRFPAPLVLSGAGLVVVLAVVLIGGFVWPGFFTGADSAASDSPQALVDRYLTDLRKGDAVDMNNSLVCADHKLSATQLQQTQQVYDQVKVVSATAGQVAVSGATATVSITAVSAQNGSNTQVLNLKRVKGNWCVEGFQGS